jgi:hypothetical protein
MLGLKIKFAKSEVILIHRDQDKICNHAEFFNSQTVFFLVRYLGVPVSPSILHAVDWLPPEETSAKKLDI